MIQKIKDWLIGKVIMGKVAGKFIKHAIGAIAGLEIVQKFLAETGINVDWAKLETWAVVAGAGVFGALWNFIEHRVK